MGNPFICMQSGGDSDPKVMAAKGTDSVKTFIPIQTPITSTGWRGEAGFSANLDSGP